LNGAKRVKTSRLPRLGVHESRFFAGRQTFSQDATFLFRLGRELVRGLHSLATAGPCILVTGRAPCGWSWIEALAVSRAMGTWCAAQGFGVITLGEPGLAEALASSCERAGGRAVRCELDPAQLPSVRTRAPAPARKARLQFTLEIARRIACAKFARATLALAPTGESPGTLHFLHALARFERLADHPILLVGAGQWEPAMWDPLLLGPIAGESTLATQLIEDVGDLSRALDFR
jgi:hypothetical protein